MNAPRNLHGISILDQLTLAIALSRNLSAASREWVGMIPVPVPADPHFAVWKCGEVKVLMAISTSLVRYINGWQRHVAHCYCIWMGHSMQGRSRMLWRPPVTLRVPSLCFSLAQKPNVGTFVPLSPLSPTLLVLRARTNWTMGGIKSYLA